MQIEKIHTVEAPEPVGPYSQATKVGNTIYVSGQIGINPLTGKLINENITLETERVLRNLEAILEAAGSSLKMVVKCSIFVKDITHFAVINEVYNDFMGKSSPARETVEVTRLPLNANIEISCIAIVSS